MLVYSIYELVSARKKASYKTLMEDLDRHLRDMRENSEIMMQRDPK